METFPFITTIKSWNQHKNQKATNTQKHENYTTYTFHHYEKLRLLKPHYPITKIPKTIHI